MQRLKDMYARNTSTHEQDRPPQPQGVKQLLQVPIKLQYSAKGCLARAHGICAIPHGCKIEA